MNKKFVLILVLMSVVFVSVFQTANAATISSATLDKTKYLPGQTGYISVTVYNELSDNIRVTELTATIDYFYEDGTVYVQQFFTSEALPSEISAGQSKTYQIPFSLPVNIAYGLTNPTIDVRTDRWILQDLRWRVSERTTDTDLKLYIEASSLNNITLLLIFVAVIVVAAVAFLMYLAYTRKIRIVPPL